MNKTKDKSEPTIHQAQFVWIRPSSKLSKKEMFERMRTFPERAAKFLEKMKAEKEKEEC